jgi:hypothetical protein
MTKSGIFINSQGTFCSHPVQIFHMNLFSIKKITLCRKITIYRNADESPTQANIMNNCGFFMVKPVRDSIG